jgi:hypothetical protein
METIQEHDVILQFLCFGQLKEKLTHNSGTCRFPCTFYATISDALHNTVVRAGVPTGFEAHVVIPSHTTNAVKWVTEHASIVHDLAHKVLTPLGSTTPAVLYEYTGGKFTSKQFSQRFSLMAITHPCIFPTQGILDEVCHLAHSIWTNNPSGEGTTRAGQSKRGLGAMKSVGYNLPRYALRDEDGGVRTYIKSKDTEASSLHQVWGEAIRYMEYVSEHCKLAMGEHLSSIARDLLSSLYSDRVLDAGLECEVQDPTSKLIERFKVAATRPPILGMSCHNLHQTCNTGVDAHLDSNDLFTIISWAVRGSVNGPFALHAHGYYLPIQVRTWLC